MEKTTGIKSDCCSNLPSNGNGHALNLKKALRPARGKKATGVNGQEHPDHTSQIKRLNRVVGQIEGIKRMVSDRRYCPDILLQTRAAASALKSIEMAILDTHLRHCVSEALASKDVRKATSKMEEIVKVVSRF